MNGIIMSDQTSTIMTCQTSRFIHSLRGQYDDDTNHKRNHLILKSKDRTMSSEEVLNNFVVIGSLLEMLATENLRVTDEWGYQLND